MKSVGLDSLKIQNAEARYEKLIRYKNDSGKFSELTRFVF